MKSLIPFFCVVSILAACSSKPKTPHEASENAAETYSALNVKEQDGRARNEKGQPTLGAAIAVKSVGGLNCRKVSVVHPNATPRYSCTKEKDLNAQELYKTLNAEEKDARPHNTDGTPTIGANIQQKSAGGLTCRKMSYGPGVPPKYECTSQF